MQDLKTFKQFIGNEIPDVTPKEKEKEPSTQIALPDAYSSFGRLKEILKNQGYSLTKDS